MSIRLFKFNFKSTPTEPEYNNVRNAKGFGPEYESTTNEVIIYKPLLRSPNKRYVFRYGRETDVSIAQARREQRKRLFAGYQVPNKISNIENIDPYR